MSIGKIKVIGRNGATLGELKGAIKLRPGNDSLVIEASASDRFVTLSSPYYNDIYAKAKEELVLDRWVSTINSQEPSDDGAFFLLGSPCVSWSYVYSEETASSIQDKLPGGLYGSKTQIIVNDLCSACSTCEAVLRTKKIIEHYKIVLNAIKDANIYADSILQARQDYLRGQRLPVTAACKGAVEDLDPAILDRFEIVSNRLLGQYMTAVHMWNYLAGKKENKTELGQSSEDAAGFYIYSKYHKPTCDGVSDIECEIVVTMIQGQTGLSTYVPSPTITFEPFTQDGGAPMVSTLTMTSGTNGKLEIKRAQGGAAGTKIGDYIVQAKWLPFYAVKQEIVNGTQVDPTLYDSCTYERTTTPDTEKGGENVTYSKLAISVSKTTLDHTPTKSEYIKYRQYLATASSTINRWQVSITWKLTGKIVQEHTDTYYYETPGVSEPVTGMYRNTTLHNPGTSSTD